MSLDVAAPGCAGRFVLLAPIEPAPGGNGLAMRAELFRRAAPAGDEVRTVVVPVAGRSPVGATAGALIVTADPERTRAAARSLAADAAWRERLARAQSLPPPARAASPGLADDVVRALGDGGSGPVGLHVVRAYMAPLGVAVAERLSAAWATLDLDEDDAAFARSRGDVEGAASYERLLAVFAPLFDGLAAASAGEAAAIGARHGLPVEHLPNAVALAPGPPAPRTPGAAGEPLPSLLFVGNLTYAPNVEAARVLVNEILPALTRRSGRGARVTLAGPHHGELAELGAPGVEVAGFVPDLAPLYASADVVVVPLRTGAGTRIKLLEAFAHRVPVVASAAAAAGLEVTPGRHLLLADGPEHAAAAIEAIVGDPALAERLVGEALRLVRDRYAPDVVIPAISGFYAGAAQRALRRRQPPP